MDIIKLIQNECHRFSVESNYWLFRTDGGYLYSTFKENGLVAFGYPTLTIEEIYHSFNTGTENKSKLYDLVNRKIEKAKRPGLIVAQINKFFNEIKKNDFILIPDTATDRLSVGIILENEVKHTELFKKNRDDTITKIKDYYKTKKVKWLKETYKNSIDPNLYKLFFNHQTIANANAYANLVNSMLYNYYYFNENYHLILELDKDNIAALNLFQSFADILTIANNFTKNKLANEEIEDIKISINLNSPGKMELFGKTMVTLFIAGVIVVALNGGGFKFKSTKLGLDTELQTPGLIKNINEFLNSEVDRNLKKSLEKKIDSLDVKNPNDIVKMLNEINMKNQND